MVEAALSVASAMATSHAVVQLFQHDRYIVYYCWHMFIHACLTIETFGDCSHQQQSMLYLQSQQATQRYNYLNMI